MRSIRYQNLRKTEKKRDVRLRTSGFFASKTIGLDLNTMQAMDNYGIRDDQEVGNQVEICKAFGFDIPIGCTPTYTSKAQDI